MTPMCITTVDTLSSPIPPPLQVSFVFTCQIDGQLKPQPSNAPPPSRGNFSVPSRAYSDSLQENRRTRGSRPPKQALLPPAPPPSAISTPSPTNRVPAPPFAGPPRVATWQELNSRGPTTPSPTGWGRQPLVLKRVPEITSSATEAHLKRKGDEEKTTEGTGRRVSLRQGSDSAGTSAAAPGGKTGAGVQTQVSKPAAPHNVPATKQVSDPLKGMYNPLSPAHRQEVDSDTTYLLNFAPTQPNPDETQTGMPETDQDMLKEVDPVDIATWAAGRGSIGNQDVGDEEEGVVGEGQKKVISISDDETSEEEEEEDEGEEYSETEGEMESDDE